MTDEPNPDPDGPAPGGPAHGEPAHGEPTAVAAATATLAAWNRLDQLAQLVVGRSIGAIVVTILGQPFGSWASTDFVLVVLVAAGIALIAAMLGRNSHDPEPLAMLEAGAATVLGVLAVWNLVEVLFDVGEGVRGGIVGLLFAVALAVAGVAVVAGSIKRLGGVRALQVTQGRGATVAVGGFIAALIGWAINLSIGHWTMAQASLSLAVLTVATAIVLASRRIASPVPAAWAGVVLGVFGAILAFGQWSDLITLGHEDVVLSAVDFLAFLVYAIGVVLVIAGGVMTALEQRPVTFAMDAVETEPADPTKRVD